MIDPSTLPNSARRAMERKGLRHPANCPCRECWLGDTSKQPTRNEVKTCAENVAATSARTQNVPTTDAMPAASNALAGSDPQAKRECLHQFTTFLPKAGGIQVCDRCGAKLDLGFAAPKKKTSRSNGERALQDEIESFCRVKGWPCYRSRMDRKTSMPVGTPDFLICVPNQRNEGLFVAIECKVPPKKATDEQMRHLGAILRAGGRAMLVTSSKQAIDFLIETHEEL